jgi:hypothetical protein
MIYDLDENPTLSTAIFVAPGTEKEFSQLVDCAAGDQLTATANNPDGSANLDVDIFARADPGDAWTDIIAGPLAIGSFAPERKQFYFKIAVDISADDTSLIPQIIRSRA